MRQYSMKSILNKVNSPEDIKKLDIPQLACLAREIRQYIVSTVANSGGHLAPSLGVVELTLALHYIYDTPKDKIVWDVGHQSYAHKIITGRRELFQTIRQHKGLSGFPRIEESDYDAFGVGHSSTAISAAFGMACARDLSQENFHVIAVVGDGALGGGLSFEGLNNAGASGKDFVVVLNDNSMSISPNVGAISKYLTGIISNPIYNRIKNEIWDITGKFDGMGSIIRKTARKMEESMKAFITPGVLFERLGFRYLGPVDGHNIAGLVHLFREVKKFKGPILVHLLTKKGKGYEPAEKDAQIFHGLGKFDPMTGNIIKNSSIPTYTQVFGDILTKIAALDQKIVAITAAMQIGTGLSKFAQEYPDRFFDVGIAEGHAVTFAAGMASQGKRPVCAIYSTFLQRAYDMIIHDVALQKLPVIFAIDRAGLVGDDGPTHHGVYDIAFLRTIPNMVIMSPKDENEMAHMLYTASQYKDGPIALRYPRGHGTGCPIDDNLCEIPIGTSETIFEGDNIVLLAVGHLVNTACQAAQFFKEQYDRKIAVINTRCIKPIDTEMLTRVAMKYKLVITIEDGTVKGGLGSAVSEYFFARNFNSLEVIQLGIPDNFIEHGERNTLYEQLGLSVNGIIATIENSKTFLSLKKNFIQHLLKNTHSS